MSFGFSISDFALCATFTYRIYRALKDAPKECEIFAQEVLHLHSVLKTLADDIASVSEQSGGCASLANRLPGLSESGSRCIELLLADIAGQKDLSITSDLRHDVSWFTAVSPDDSWCNSHYTSFTQPSLRKRFSQAKFARRIPHLREAVANIVSKLTAESVLIIRYDLRIPALLKRISLD